MYKFVCGDLLYTAIVNERSYFINTDFRVWIEVSRLFQDMSLSNSDKVYGFLDLVVNGRVEFCDIEVLAEELLKFFAACERGLNVYNNKSGDNSSRAKSSNKCFDYDYDWGYIFAAFMEQYGLNLSCCSLHWHEFRALFNALSEDTEFVKIMGYRAIRIVDIKDKEKRKFYKKMKDIHALPRKETASLSVEGDFVDMLDKLF